MDTIKYFQGVGWVGDVATKNHRYAQSMGFKYVYHGIGDNPASDKDYEKSDDYKLGRRFLVNDFLKVLNPDVVLSLDQSTLNYCKTTWPGMFGRFPRLPRVIDMTVMDQVLAYDPAIYDAYRAAIEQYAAKCDPNAAFPDNIATTQTYGGSANQFTLLPDFRSPVVRSAYVSASVNHILDHAEVTSLDYLCAGFCLDVTTPWNPPEPTNRKLPTNEVGAYRDGFLLYLNELKSTMESTTGRPMYYVFEPGDIYSEWVTVLSNSGVSPTIKENVKGDLIMAEHPAAFYSDSRITNSGYFTVGDLASSTPNVDMYGGSGYANVRDLAGPIAVAGAWLESYGIWDRAGLSKANGDAFNADPTWFKEQVKLARLVPSWDNLNGATDRSYDAATKTYASTHSHASGGLIWSYRPDDGRLYVVFVGGNSLTLPVGQVVTSAKRVNGYWEENGDGMDDLTVVGNQVTLKSSAYSRKAYILTVASSADEKLSNAGFEQGITAWSGGGATLVVSTSTVHNGALAMRTTNRTEKYHGPSQDVTARLKSFGPGSCEIEAWARLGSGSALMKAQLKVVDDLGAHYYSPQATVGSSWTRISGSYNVTWTGTLVSAKLFISCENQTVDTYVDDCSLLLTLNSAEILDLDNGDAEVTTVGMWNSANSVSGYVGSDYWHDGNTGASGGKNVKYVPTVVDPGNYHVYINYTSHTNRASNVPVDVAHAGGTNTYLVDQRSGGGSLVEIGSGFPFAAGGSGYVRIRNDGTNGYVIADAVVLVASTPGSTVVEIDNTAGSGVALTGGWTASSATLGFVGTNYLQDGDTGSAGGKAVQYMINVAVTGYYKVYINYTSHANRASNVPVDIVHHNGTTTVRVDERTQGGVFVDLGGVYLLKAGEQSSVTIRNDGADGYVIADAVKWVLQ